MKTVILQSFYGNCISACFVPFLILKDISDRKKMTKYGYFELEYLSVIALLSIIQIVVVEWTISRRFAYHEDSITSTNKKIIWLRLFCIIAGGIYIYYLFSNPTAQIASVSG